MPIFGEFVGAVDDRGNIYFHFFDLRKQNNNIFLLVSNGLIWNISTSQHDNWNVTSALFKRLYRKLSYLSKLYPFSNLASDNCDLLLSRQINKYHTVDKLEVIFDLCEKARIIVTKVNNNVIRADALVG